MWGRAYCIGLLHRLVQTAAGEVLIDARVKASSITMLIAIADI
jgi:hypothetical protein